MSRSFGSLVFGCVTTLLLSSPALAILLSCPHGGPGQQLAKFRNYTIQTVRTEDGGCLEVRKSGVIVYRESNDGAYGIGNRINNDLSTPVIPVGTDVTGGGVPDVIVWSWSGGAHCCLTFQVLQLGEKLLDVADISADDSVDAHFADLRHDGHYEFVGRDWAFAYWHASFAMSPAPEIILRPSGLRISKGAGPNDYYIYDLALDLMRKPTPSPANFRSLARQLAASNQWRDNGVPSKLWSAMLHFIYTGHPGLAWKLLDETWPNKRPGKGGFIGAFCDRLDYSHYSDDLSPLLKDAPPDCFR